MNKKMFIYLPKKTNITFRWKPEISINRGVKIMLDNIKDWESAPVWTRSKIKSATTDWFKYLK